MNIQFSKKIVSIFFLINSVIFAQGKINQLDDKGNKHGLWKGVYEDTKYPKYEGEFKHGKEVGIFTFYDNTKVKKIVATRDFSANDGSCYTIIFNGKHKVSEGKLVNKVHEGRPHIQDRIKNGEYVYIVNTTAGRQAIEDSKLIRRSALQYKVHYDTTLNGGFATAMALSSDPTEQVISVQEMHAKIKK